MQETELQEKIRETMKRCIEISEEFDRLDDMLCEILSVKIQPLLDSHQYDEAIQAVYTFYKNSGDTPLIGKNLTLHKIRRKRDRYKTLIGEGELNINGKIILLDKPAEKFYVYLGHRVAPLKTFDSLVEAEDFCIKLKM